MTIIEAKQEEIDEMKEYIDAKQNEIDSFDRSEYYTEEQYEEVLNELFGDVDVCGSTFNAGSLLKDNDNIAFRTGMNDHVDSMNNDDFEEYKELLEDLEVLDCQKDDLVEELETLLEEGE